MMHHPNMHHQAMSGHPPQHMPSHQMPTHHQMPPPQMHRESRMPMGPGAAGGMAHGQLGGMGALPVHHGPTRPPHAIRPMHHPPQQHHSVPQQMKPLRRGYVSGGYGPGAAPGLPPQYAPPPPLQPPPASQPPGMRRPTSPVFSKPQKFTPMICEYAASTPATTASVPLADAAEPAPATDAAAAGDAEPPRAAAQANSKEKTPMCLVNELARYNKIKHQYRLTSETGPAHKKVFTVTLRLGDTEEYTAEGSSIKRAQHAAAHAALAGTGYPAPPPRALHPAHSHSLPRQLVMPTVELNALAMKLCQPAVYSVVGTAGGGGVPRYPRPRPPYRMPLALCRPLAPALYRVRVSVGGRAWLGEGGTPQAARHDAAGRALRDLKANAGPAPPPQPQPQPQGDGNNAAADILSSEVKSPVSLVHELALKRNLSVIFSVKSERGPPHMRVFITTCTVGDMETEGEGNGKKVSKRRAAERMLEEMKRRWPAALLRPRAPEPRRAAPPKRKPRNLVKEGTTASSESQSGADNPISRLAVARHAVRARSPQYRVLEERGAARRREFLVQCDAPPHAATGRGPNKKTAKRRAAANVLLAMEMANGTTNGEAAASPASSGDAILNTSAENKITTEAKRKEPESATNGGANSDVRQPVPGVLMMDYHQRSGQPTAPNGVSESSATGGSSPGAKDQLMYLSQLLGFTVHFSDFPKRNHGEYLSLVSLSTEPPVMCHGGGASTAHSHEQCARAALRALELMGLDAPAASAAVPGTAAKPGVISNGISE